MDSVFGKPTFECFVSKIDPTTLIVNNGDTIEAYLYAPCPPNTETKLYTRGDKDSLVENFRRSDYLKYLFRVDITADQKGNFQWDVVMRLNDENLNTYESSKSLFFKVK